MFGLLVTAIGHGLLGTPALLQELRKAQVDPQWIVAIKAVWILLSVNLAFLSALVVALFIRKNPISSQALANSIAFSLAEAGYLFLELGVFPGAVLMAVSGALLLVAPYISTSQRTRIQ